MSFEVWLAFVAASAAMLAIPGPTVMLVVSYALARGRSSGWYTVPGVTLGDFTAMSASLLGAGAIFAASATLFAMLKFAGALYLIWLGIKLWRTNAKLDHLQDVSVGQSQSSMFWNSYVVTALNPKAIIFFVAFVPLFIDPARPGLQQFAILEATFLTLAAVNVAIWAILAGQMRRRFKQAGTLKLANRIGGSFLIGAGLLTAAVGRNN